MLTMRATLLSLALALALAASANGNPAESLESLARAGRKGPNPYLQRDQRWACRGKDALCDGKLWGTYPCCDDSYKCVTELNSSTRRCQLNGEPMWDETVSQGSPHALTWGIEPEVVGRAYTFYLYKNNFIRTQGSDFAENKSKLRTIWASEFPTTYFEGYFHPNPANEEQIKNKWASFLGKNLEQMRLSEILLVLI